MGQRPPWWTSEVCPGPKVEKGHDNKACEKLLGPHVFKKDFDA